MKTEPSVYSILDLERDLVTPWEGVRNYQARNFMRDAMQPGDPVLIYHSNAEPPGVAGVAHVHSAPYPDPSAFNPESRYFDPLGNPAKAVWMLVDIAYDRAFDHFVPLALLRQIPSLENLLVLKRGNRLSILPVEQTHFSIICRLGLNGP